MKRVSIFALFALLLATAMPCFGQQPGQSNARGCDLTGTWYGGSDLSVPYYMTIEPIGSGRYLSRGQQAIDLIGLGFLAWTDWTGEYIKGTGQKYETSGTAFFVLGPEQAAFFGLFGGTLELDVVHATLQFGDDCNTFVQTIDSYGGYIPWTPDKVPFVTEPDYNFLELIGIGTIVETYHRVSTACPICPFGSSANSALSPHAAKLGKKR